eukprot:scaffold222611_cov40-Tisochrysis_lutea.AAC.4
MAACKVCLALSLLFAVGGVLGRRLLGLACTWVGSTHPPARGRLPWADWRSRWRRLAGRIGTFVTNWRGLWAIPI